MDGAPTRALPRAQSAIAMAGALLYAHLSMGLRGERYETLRVIASGGMATVHLGRALGMGGFERLVAIKVMHPHVASEPESVSMFLDEARLAARIRHPNVVSTLDVQQDSEGVFLVMDYIEGPSLQQALKPFRKSREPFPLDVALRIMLDALAGLHAAHELEDASGRPLNLIHRDVSPQNILIGSDGIARITDFGVARAEARFASTQNGQLKGKLSYMAPEQVRQLDLDRRVDVYAAGVVLWELLTGARLIAGDSELTMLTLAGLAEHKSPRTINPSVPAPLDAACMRALAREPADRFATANDFAQALEEAADAAGQKIASTRAVAAFISDLKAHSRPVDLPEPQSGRGSGSTPSSAQRGAKSTVETGSGAIKADGSHGGAAGARDAASDAATKNDKFVTSQTPAPTTQTSLAALAAPEPSAPERGRSKLIFVGVGAAAVLCALAAAFLLGRGQPPSAADDAAPASSAPQSASPSPPASSAPPSVAPAPITAASDDAGAPSGAPPDARAAASVERAGGGDKPAGAAKPGASAAGQGGRKAGGGGPVYRPPDL